MGLVRIGACCRRRRAASLPLPRPRPPRRLRLRLPPAPSSSASVSGPAVLVVVASYGRRDRRRLEDDLWWLEGRPGHRCRRRTGRPCRGSSRLRSGRHRSGRHRRWPLVRGRAACADRLVLVMFTVVKLGFEHAGSLPSGSRAHAVPLREPLRRAGANRLRSPVRRHLDWRRRRRLASSIVTGPSSRGRPHHRSRRRCWRYRSRRLRCWQPQARRAHQPPRRAAPAPAGSPGVVTAARGQPLDAARPERRQVEQQVSCAEQPFEVWHIHLLPSLRHAGQAPA